MAGRDSKLEPDQQILGDLARVRFRTVFVRVRKRYFRIQGTVSYGFVRLDLFSGKARNVQTIVAQ